MPNPADILSLQRDVDPDDELRMRLAQGQGNNLAGAPMPPGQTGMQPQGVPGPLAAIPAATPPKPKVKLKVKKKPKPRIKLKAPPTSALQNFLNSIGPGG